MKIKKRIAKMVSILLSVAIVLTSADFTVFAQGSRDAVKEEATTTVGDNPFAYALFTADRSNSLSMNADSVVINGDIHANSDFSYQGNAISINGVLESTGRVNISVSDAQYLEKIGRISENSPVIEMQDISAEIFEEIGDDAVIHNEYASYSQATVDNDTIVYGSAGIFSSTFSGDCVFMATGDIQFGVDTLSSVDGGKVFIGSQHGNISIYASDTQMDGILYAPNGTVTITGSNVQINGRIIAKNIAFYGSNLTINASEGDLGILDCLTPDKEPDREPDSLPDLTPDIQGPSEGRENRKIQFAMQENPDSGKWTAEGITWEVYEIAGEEKTPLVKDVDYCLQIAEDCKTAEMVFPKAGAYQITSNVIYNNETFSGTSDLTITADHAPVAEIKVEECFLRDASGSVEVIIEDASYSPDGDALGSRVYRIFYDENKDGVYQDTELIQETESPETTLVYQAEKDGDYKVVLVVRDAAASDVDDESLLKTAQAEAYFEVVDIPKETEEVTFDIVLTGTVQIRPRYEYAIIGESDSAFLTSAEAVMGEYATAFEAADAAFSYELLHAWEDVKEYNGHYYWILPVKATWPNARIICENMGGHLVTISSEEENQFVLQYAKEMGRAGYVAMGLNDLEKEGTWEWITGEEVVYTNWHSGEPNNGLGGTQQDYAFMYDDAKGTWDDGYVNNTVRYFMCEWESKEAYESALTVELDKVFSGDGTHRTVILEQSDALSDKTAAVLEAGILSSGAELYVAEDGTQVQSILEAQYEGIDTRLKKYCFVGDELLLSGNYEELDAAAGYTWQYVTKYKAFGSEEAEITYSAEVPTLDKAGIYSISVEAVYTEGEESAACELVLADELMVYERPKFGVDVTFHRSASNQAEVSAAIDTESISGEIISYDCAYKKYGDREFMQGSLPEQLDLDSYYLLKLTATDVHGIKSYPVVKLISTYEADIPDVSAPEIKISFSQNPVTVNTEVSLFFAIDDVSEIGEQKFYVNGEEVLPVEGIYTFTPAETGDYEIKVVATDSKGNQGTAVSVLQVLEKTTAPEVSKSESEEQTISWGTLGWNEDRTAVVIEAESSKDTGLTFVCNASDDGKEIPATTVRRENHYVITIPVAELETGKYIVYAKVEETSENISALLFDYTRAENDDSLSADSGVLKVTIADVVLDSQAGVILVKGTIEATLELATREITCTEVDSNTAVPVNTDSLTEGVLAEIPVAGLESGEYSIKISVSDTEGRVATAGYSFTYVKGSTPEIEVDKEDKDDGEDEDTTTPEEDKVLYVYPSEYDTAFGDYKEKAKQLGNWMAVYTYVRNNTRYEYYSGVRKSAEEVYDSYGGNAADQAVLLSEMLKELGYEVRLVEGRIRITCEQAMHFTDADSVEAAAAILQMCDSNATVYYNAGGTPRYVELLHTWVEVYVPGAECGEADEDYLWVPMDTCFKSYRENETFFDELEEAGLLTLKQEEMLGAYTKDSLEEYADRWYNSIQNHTFANDSVYLNQRSITRLTELRKSDLVSFEIKERTREFEGYSAGDYDYISFDMDYLELGKINSYDLYNSRLFLRYEQLAGGYMQAVLSLNGEIVGRGPEVPSGMEQTLTMEVHSNGKRDTIRDSVKAGSFYSIVTDAQSITGKELTDAFARVQTAAETIEGADIYTETYLGALLDYAGKLYFAQTDISNILLAEQQDVILSRTLSVALLAYEKGETGDMLYIDVDLDGRVVAPKTSDLEGIKRFSLASGMISSMYESILWEQVTGEPAVSTITAFDAALLADTEMLYLTADNWAEKKALLNVSAEVYSDIEGAIRSGKMVMVPADEVTILDWTGSGYVILSMEDYSGTYRITGGMNGGTSAVLVNLAFITDSIITVKDMVQMVGMIYALLQLVAFGGPVASVVAMCGIVMLVTLFMVSIVYLADSIELLREYYAGNEAAGEELEMQAAINVAFCLAFSVGTNTATKTTANYLIKTLGREVGEDACAKLVSKLGARNGLKLIKLLKKSGMGVDDIVKLVLNVSDDGLQTLFACASRKMPAEMLLYLCKHYNLLDNYADDVLLLIARSSRLPEEIFGMLDRYGDDFLRIYLKSGDSVIDLLSKYGDSVIEVFHRYGGQRDITMLPYGEETFKIVGKFGAEILDDLDVYGYDLLELYRKHGDAYLSLYTKYGRDVTLHCIQYGDNLFALVAKHGDDFIPYVMKHGESIMTGISTHGDDFISLLVKHGDELVHIYQNLGDDVVAVLIKHGDELFSLPESYKTKAIELVMRYGDDVMEGISKYGDDFMAKYADEGDEFIEEYLEKGDEVFEDGTTPGTSIETKIQPYIEDIVDASGNVDPTKMNDLRLAIQKGTFTQAEVKVISRKMWELGITEAYETTMKNIDFGTYLRNIVGEPPEDMVNAHAHHILFKTGNGEAQQQLVKEGQEILRSYGIDPIIGEENLVWAPNGVTGQHDITALTEVVEALRAVVEMDGDYDDMVEALELMGRKASSR